MMFVILVLCLVMSSMAQVPGTGTCKKIEAVKNLNTARWMGEWYGYADFRSTNEENGRCSRCRITENPDGTVTALMGQLSDGPSPGQWERNTYQVANNNGTLTVIGPKDSPWYNYQVSIISTDYVSYIVKESCQNVGSSSIYGYWILTRSPDPSSQVLAQIQQVMRDEGMPEEYFRETNQINCPSDF